MLSRKSVVRGVRNPALAVTALHRMFPWRAMRQDPECLHLTKAWSSGKLPRVSIAELFPGVERYDVVLRKAEGSVAGWSLDLAELAHLLAVVRLTRPERILEIGTYDGHTALNIAANLDSATARLYTLDLPQNGNQNQLRADGLSNAVTSGGIVGSQYRGEPESARITQLWDNSVTMDWSRLNRPFDLIFIDGCHDYPYVRSDTINAIQSIRPGGTIFWHDYGYSVDVSRAIDEVSAAHAIRAIKGTRLACLRAA